MNPEPAGYADEGITLDVCELVVTRDAEEVLPVLELEVLVFPVVP
jgi:hypothetical protein